MTGPTDEANKDFEAREADLREQFVLGIISKSEFLRMWSDLKGDWHDALTEARMLKPDECDD
jgi:hypothetical protein